METIKLIAIAASRPSWTV